MPDKRTRTELVTHPDGSYTIQAADPNVSDSFAPRTPEEEAGRARAAKMLMDEIQRGEDEGIETSPEATEDAKRITEMLARGERPCPGVSGPFCLNPAEPGDRYCAGCRAEFNALPEERDW